MDESAYVIYSNMKNNLLFTVLVAAIISGLVGWYMGSMSQKSSGFSKTADKMMMVKDTQFSMNMRKLWEDHIVWTRLWIVSEAYNTGEADANATRLLQNQEDIGTAIKPYYGEEAGNQLTALLTIHITTAVDLVKAAKVGNTVAMTQANDMWYENGNEIADFLASANPNWSRDDLRAMMKEHLDLTKQEAVNILEKNYEESVTDYDKVHEEILMMSDALSFGIIKQFPEKF
jgi:hypothetical protein